MVDGVEIRRRRFFNRLPTPRYGAGSVPQQRAATGMWAAATKPPRPPPRRLRFGHSITVSVGRLIAVARKADQRARRIGVAAARGINKAPAARPLSKESRIPTAGMRPCDEVRQSYGNAKYVAEHLTRVERDHSVSQDLSHCGGPNSK